MVVRTTNPKGNCCTFLLPTRGYTKRKSMAKASIHFAKASDGGLNHNDRTEKTEPEYLLAPEYRLGNVFDFSAQDAAKNLRALYAAAKVNYKEAFGQKLQAKNYTWEAVVNLNSEHGLSDVKKLVLEIEKKTGFKSLQIAIHLDEGRLEKAKDGSVFPIHNRHAHITFFTLDQTNGKQLMRQDIPPRERMLLREEIIKDNPELRGEKNKRAFNKVYQGLRAKRYQVFDREKLSELQDLTAKVLNMERGLKGSKTQRLEHKQYKAVKRQEAKTENQTLAKQKDLKAEMSKLRTELQELGAVRADYAKLEQVNKELKKEIQEKNLTTYELQKKITLWRHEETNWQNGKKYKDLYEALSQENKELKNELKANLSDSKSKDEEFIATRHKNTPEDKIKLIMHGLKSLPKQSESDELNDEINSTLSKSVDYMLEKNTKTVEKKSFLYTETKEELDLKAFISDLKQVEKEHRKNYHSFVELFKSFKKFATKVKSIFKNPFEHKEKTNKEIRAELMQEVKDSSEKNAKANDIEEVEQRLKDSVNEYEENHRRGFRR